MTKKPLPASAACVSICVMLPPPAAPSQAVTSSINATAAEVASASGRGVSTPAISTGSTSSAT